MTREPTTPAPSAMKLKVVAPPERVYSVWFPQLVDLEGRVRFFPALPTSKIVFVCELTICMEIDQSPRFTRLRDVPVWIGGSISSFLSTSQITCFIFATALILDHINVKKKHSLTSEGLATDIVEHTEVHADTLQPVCTPLAQFGLYLVVLHVCRLFTSDDDDVDLHHILHSGYACNDVVSDRGQT